MADPSPAADAESTDFTRRQIDNPLRHYTLDQLDKAATDFAKLIGADPTLFIKAVRVARDPPNWKKVDGLTREEKVALKYEKRNGFFRQPKALITTIATLVFSAMTQGWIQSVSNGANQTMPRAFALKNECGSQGWKSREAIWQFAAINSITYLSAAIFGCWFSDPLQSKKLGRRGAICISACLCIIGAVGAGTASRWWQELVWRLILGLGLGAKASVTPIFGAEVAPSHLRGMLVMNWQLFDALGIFGGFTANLVAYSTGNSAWRWQIASAGIPSVCLLCLIFAIPESPRWLLKKGRAAAELFYAHAQIQMEVEYMQQATPMLDPEKQTNGGQPQHQDDVSNLSRLQYYRQEVEKTHYWTRLLQLFRNGRTRRATVAASVVMLGQQLCGVNVLQFYSTVFFRDVNQPSPKAAEINALWLSWGLGLANFVFTIPAYWGIDTLGRRFLLLATYPGMIISMFGASMSFLGGTDDERNIRVGVFMFLFIFFYSLGQGPVAFAYSSEVFPLFNREVGMSWAVFVNLFFAGLLTLFVPQAQVSTRSAVTGHHDEPELRNALNHLNGTARCDVINMQDTLVLIQDGMNGGSNWTDIQAKLLGVFVAFGVFSFILIYFFVPETKLAAAGKKSKRAINYISLEELNHIFKVPTIYFIRWQLTKVLPYEWELVKYLLKRRPDMPHLEDMHQWYKDRRDNDGNDDEHDNNANDEDHDTDEDNDSEDHTPGGSEMAEIQQAYNPGSDFRRRWHNRRQRRRQTSSRNHHIQQVSGAGNGIAAPLELPHPPYQQSEGAGSIEWEPNEHPSPDPSRSRPRSRGETGEAADTEAVSPPSSRDQEAVRSHERPPQGDSPSPEIQAGLLDTRAEESANRRPWRSESYVPPSPQIRRKPLPPTVRARDNERYDGTHDRT